VITAPRWIVDRTASTSVVDVVAVHNQTAPSAPNSRAATDPIKNPGRRRTLTGAVGEMAVRVPSVPVVAEVFMGPFVRVMSFHLA